MVSTLHLKRLATQFLCRSGLVSLVLSGRSANPLILMYHGVTETPNSPAEVRNADFKHLYFKDFRTHLRILRKYRSVVPLTEMVQGLQSGADMRNTVSITFDDGYENNVVVAAPILSEHGMSATFFLTTGLISTDNLMWTDRLEIILNSTTKRHIELSGSLGTWNLSTVADRVKALRGIKELLKAKTPAGREALLSFIGTQMGVENVSAQADYRLMNWDQARSLVRDGFEIGAHTVTHPILAQIPFEQAKSEILQSKDQILRELGICSPIFCYPNGSRGVDYTPEISEFCSKHFEAALSADRGIARRSEMFDLRRLSSYDGQLAPGLDWLLVREK